MIGALTTLLVYQLVGEIASRVLGLPIPGPVLGMLMLFITLLVRGGPGEELQSTASGLLQHLSLLFVPAGTGVMLHFARVGDEWLPLLVALVGSTLITLAVTVLVMRMLAGRTADAGEGRAP